MIDAPERKPEAVDLSHALSVFAKSIVPSPLKQLFPYMKAHPNAIMLGGGLPPADYFPFQSLSSDVLLPTAFASVNPTGSETIRIDVPFTDADPDKAQMSSALQYQAGYGIASLEDFIQEFTNVVYDPGYSNYTTALCASATEAWDRISMLLLTPGDAVLIEEFSFPGGVARVWPQNVRPVAVHMDEGGIDPKALDTLLGTWKPQDHDGRKRPHVLYTIPVCQNPTGASPSVERKMAIYEICVKYDVVIVEDDPYYFLQAGTYVAPEDREAPKNESSREFIDSLIPSYLKLDYQGRVIRIDTFSKTLGPGLRLGWITCQPKLAEVARVLAFSTVQSPSGVSQAILGRMLNEVWGLDGYLTWLKGMKHEYGQRRDRMVDALIKNAGVIVGSGKLPKGTKLSMVPPEGGMFVWVRVHTTSHPLFNHPEKGGSSNLVISLFQKLANADVLVCPGNAFSTGLFGVDDSPIFDHLPEGLEGKGRKDFGQEVDGNIRVAFSTPTPEEIERATTIIGQVVEEFWKET